MKRLSLILLLLGATALTGVLLKPVETYRAETLAFWPEKEGPPATFAVDEEGRVVVVPRSGDRLFKLLPGRGRWQEVPLTASGKIGPWVADLVADGAGGFFAVDQGGSLLWSISPDGKAIPYFEASAKGEKRLIQGVAVDGKGQAYLDMVRLLPAAYAREIVRLEENPKESTVVARVILDEGGWHWDPEADPTPSGTLSLAPSGHLFFLEPRETDMSLLIRVLSPGKASGTIRVDSVERLGRAEVVGTDAKGHVYVGLNLGTPEGTLLKVSRDGKARWVLPLPMDPGAPSLRRYAQVDERGNLYVMRPSEKGFEIRFYRLVKSYQWRWTERTGP